MALTYTGSTGLFTHLGKFVARINSYPTIASTTLATDLTTLLTALGTMWLPSEGLAAAYEQYKNSVSGWRQGLGKFCDRRILDPTTVLLQLSLPTSASLQQVLAALVQQMALDGQTVKASVVTLGSVVAGPSQTGGSNHGNGVLFVSKILDGYTPPGLSMPANLNYNGQASQLAVPSDTMVLQCTSDAEQDGIQEGQETFSWNGNASYPDLDYHAEGSGQGPTIRCANANQLISNQDFESWSANVPTGWTLDNGVAGTHIFQETTNIFRGSNALKFLGDGSLATIQISQAVNPVLLKTQRQHLVAIAVKASGVPASGTLLVQFAGTGYTPASTEKISIAHGSLPTTWTISSFWINLPAVLPSDWKLTIAATGTLTNGTALYLDSLVFSPVQYHAGVGCQIVAGSSQWLKGDRLTFTVANDGAGKFQDFFRRHYGTQLPSKTDGSETITDSLVV